MRQDPVTSVNVPIQGFKYLAKQLLTEPSALF